MTLLFKAYSSNLKKIIIKLHFVLIYKYCFLLELISCNSLENISACQFKKKIINLELITVKSPYLSVSEMYLSK